jgi:hypothetical protein
LGAFGATRNWEFVPLKTMGVSMFFEGNAYCFVGKEGWDEADIILYTNI